MDADSYRAPAFALSTRQPPLTRCHALASIGRPRVTSRQLRFAAFGRRPHCVSSLQAISAHPLHVVRLPHADQRADRRAPPPSAFMTPWCPFAAPLLLMDGRGPSRFGSVTDGLSSLSLPRVPPTPPLCIVASPRCQNADDPPIRVRRVRDSISGAAAGGRRTRTLPSPTRQFISTRADAAFAGATVACVKPERSLSRRG